MFATRLRTCVASRHSATSSTAKVGSLIPCVHRLLAVRASSARVAGPRRHGLSPHAPSIRSTRLDLMSPAARRAYRARRRPGKRARDLPQDLRARVESSASRRFFLKSLRFVRVWYLACSEDAARGASAAAGARILRGRGCESDGQDEDPRQGALSPRATPRAKVSPHPTRACARFSMPTSSCF